MEALCVDLGEHAMRSRGGWLDDAAKAVGRPYKWAQYMAQNTAAGPLTLPRGLHRRHVAKSMRLLAQRSAARDALHSQLSHLRKDREIPLRSLDHDQIADRFQLKPTAQLTEFAALPAQGVVRIYKAVFTRSDRMCPCRPLQGHGRATYSVGRNGWLVVPIRRRTAYILLYCNSVSGQICHFY
jgi:hypothetical protein